MEAYSSALTQHLRTNIAKRRIEEALYQDERIKEINNFDFTIEDNKVHVSFTVYTVYGYTTISKGVEY